jgi:hypothetical protein
MKVSIFIEDLDDYSEGTFKYSSFYHPGDGSASKEVYSWMLFLRLNRTKEIIYWSEDGFWGNPPKAI